MNEAPTTRLRKISPIRRLMGRPEFGSLAGVLLVFAFFAVVAGDRGFLTPLGTVNYLEVAAQLGLLASTVSLLMIAGEFDLSVGSMIGAAGMALAIPVAIWGWPMWAGILLAFGLAALFGYLNGYLVVRTGLPSFIVTLASLFVLRGATLGFTRWITSRTRVSGLHAYAQGDPLAALFSGDPLGVPVSIWWWILLTLLASFVLLKTPFGNWIFGAGGDPKAAHAVGVPVARVKITLFVATALSAALLAVIQVLDTGSADVLRGELKELEAIAAAVIGGNLLTGGYGSVIGGSLGALLLGMVKQGIFFTGINTDWFKVFLGTLLLAAVLFNDYLRKKALEAPR